MSGLAEFADRFGGLAEGFERLGEVVVGRDVGRIELDGGAEGGDRFTGAVGGEESGTKVTPGDGVIGVEADGFAEMSDGGVEAIVGEIDAGEVVVGVAGGRVGTERGFKALLCFVDAIEGEQGGAGGVEGRGVGGSQGEGFLIEAESGLELAGVLLERGDGVDGEEVLGIFFEAAFERGAMEGAARVGAGVVGLRQELQPEVSHLVLRAIAVDNALRRLMGIARVGGGVVVAPTHVDGGAFGQMNGLAIAIDGLPVDVPVGDVEQGQGLAVGEIGPGFDVVAEVVGVGIDGEQVSGYGQGEAIGDLEIFGIGGDVEGVVALHLNEHGGLGGRGVGEVDADGGLEEFGLAGGLEMGVEDEVGTGAQSEGKVSGFFGGGGAGLPEEEVAVGFEGAAFDDDVHAGEAGFGVEGIAAAGLAGTID